MRAARLLENVLIAMVFILSMVDWGRATPQSDASQTPPGQDRKDLRVLHPRGHAVSRPVRDLPRQDRPPDFDAPEPGKTGPSKPAGGGNQGNTDPALQKVYPTSAPPVVFAQFGGLTWTGSVPPDTNLAVGDTQVMEIVNSQFMIYDKIGNPQLPNGPATLKSVFAPLGSDPCATYGGGDPVVVYDRIANRWVTTHYTFTPNYMCIGVSQTPDATGAYNLYSYAFGPNTADYAKFGVWRDGYYMSANTFSPSGQFLGGQACAFDRAALLAGAVAPAVVCFQSAGSWASLLPADLDSLRPPAAGTPAYFVNMGNNALNLYKFHADFVTPSNSTFTGPSAIPVAKFDVGCGGCVPQPGTNETLETLASRLMFRLSYQNFGSYESLLVNHTVQIAFNSNSKTQTGVRWYEIRNPAGTPVIAQQSTFSPDATTYRWMGSIAQDKQGNMFLGYSASSATVFPSIRYTGRLATDPLNQMQPEKTLVTGMGNQIKSPTNTSGRDRWGDYATVALDPVDSCTFWFATEYLTVSGYNNWATHLLRAKFAGCN
ncbi:MAG TPA: hypothetical protein VFV78_11520 [Vicinamibacterales bacterium]|nr:hypothetical protein [Vicinamibacterales bacterium]